MAREWNFGTISVRHGTPARRELDFVWADESPRDLSGLNGFLRVYSDQGSTLLFPEVALAEGAGASQRILNLTAAQCTWPQKSSGYYAEIEFRDGAGNVIADGGWFGTFSLAGR